MQIIGKKFTHLDLNLEDYVNLKTNSIKVNF
jgi:hypothetical protein